MEVRPEILYLTLASALVTAVPRVLPLMLLSRLRLPAWLRDWLALVPAAAIAALLTSQLAVAGGEVALQWRELVAILSVLFVSIVWRSLVGAIGVGIATMALLRAVS